MSADSTTDLSHPVLNLSADEKRAFSFLFSQADSDQLGVVTGERAVAFFERTKVSPNVLGEIWQIADIENRGLLTKPGFCMVLRLIGHYQVGREPSAELAFKQGPVPKFEGLQIPGIGPAASAALPSPTGVQFPATALQPQLSGQGPIRVPPLDAQKVQQYSGLFERSGAQDGMLDAVTAKTIFERAGLPNEALGKIWNLSDRQQRGALDQTEFIVAMYLLTSMKSRTMSALPNNLPPALYEAAARRGAPPPPGARNSFVGQGAVPRQFTGGAVGTPARTQSPLARQSIYGTPPTQSAQMTGTPWLVTAQQKAKYDQFFASIDTQGRGVLTGEQAVQFFSDSRLPEDSLAAIWDLADIKSEGQLNRDEFAVAMYLIGQQRSPNPAPLPAFLPPALVPPGMRQQQQQQQQGQSTAPAFDNAQNTSAILPKSAADDLFGLDEPSLPTQQQPQTTGFQAPAPVLQPQTTGASTSRDPFGSVPTSPSSPQRFQSQPQPASTVFKPFMPTSAFGASIAQQHTGGSMSSSQRGFQPQPPANPSHLQTATTAEDDLLGDNEAHAAEASQITNDTTELANMSSQIGNLRTQMESTQTKKATTQADLNATQTQKRDLELRLQQFRSQYETEVRAVKELETQLSASKESTKKLSQEIAMLEGTHQDLQTQHNQVTQQLQADQQENATLKQRINQLNTEVTQLKPQIEKMKLDARQQKGLVSINKKQLTTNEGERDRLQGEKTDLEREAAEREEAREEAAKDAPQEEEPHSHFGRNAVFGTAGLGAVGAAAFGAYESVKDRLAGGSEPKSPPPAAGTLSPTNPFFRKPSSDGTTERAVSPPPAAGSGPTPSAFDALFGPSAAFSPSGQTASRSGTPPPTSFGTRNVSQPSGGDGPPANMTGSVQSISSIGEPTPSATPPLSDQAKESPVTALEHPPPLAPETRQFTPSQLPIGPLPDKSREDPEVSSNVALPPATRAGGSETPREVEPATHTQEREVPGAFEHEDDMPGAFPAEQSDVPGAFPHEPEHTEARAREVPAHEEPPAVPARGNDDFDSAFASFGGGEQHGAAAAQTGSEFDSVFAGFGGGQKDRDSPMHGDDPFAPASTSQQRSGPSSSEFPPITTHEREEDESSDEEEDREPQAQHGFGNSFGGAALPPPPEHGAAEPILPPVLSAAKHALPEANISGARPMVQSVDSTASAVPSVNAERSPPTYEQSYAPSHGGTGAVPGANQFPPEFGGLLPSREDPTSPPPASTEPTERALPEVGENERPSVYAAPLRSFTGSSSLYPNTVPQTPTTSDVFHDSFSRPISSVTSSYATPPTAQPTHHQPAPKGAFDDFDDFDDLPEAKEAGKSGPSDFDFGFGGGRQSADEFNPAFDSPPSGSRNAIASAQATPVPSARQLDSSSNYHPMGGSHNGVISSGGPFDTAGPAVPPRSQPGGSIQNTPQSLQHDWDAIFSGLDGNRGVDTSLGKGTSTDPWGASTSTAAAIPATTNGAFAPSQADRTPTTALLPAAADPNSSSAKRAQIAAQMGRAITPGTEHDDPILKRLTGMGWPRNDALNALEMYDYDINMVSLTPTDLWRPG
ncbi:hypothetical protein LTR35_015443 [Friedmanniomyces endolithicus]|nr:hypothetical protein LTR35_015443 [Friedmanniomyces endolithicus]KAK0286540.1 hypothetical protein LTS00_010478 [Friedmanniomyces endolithicus]